MSSTDALRVVCLVFLTTLLPNIGLGQSNAVVKLTPRSIGLPGAWGVQDEFPWSIAALGDLDQDGVPDIAVSAGRADRGGRGRGAVWILFMQPDGSVKSFQEISSVDGNFHGEIRDYDQFGVEVSALGDLDGDGVTELAVSSIPIAADTINFPPFWQETDVGTVWILYLNRDGTVREHAVVAPGSGGFDVELPIGTSFGASHDALGDLDGDGVTELGIAEAVLEGGGVYEQGWILFLNPDASVKRFVAINPRLGDIGRENANQGLPNEIASVGDLDGDGIPETVFASRGVVVIVFHNRDGSVRRYANISASDDWFPGNLWRSWTRDYFGHTVAPTGDLDKDGITDLVLGVEHHSGTRIGTGAVDLLFLESDGNLKWRARIDAESHLFSERFDSEDWFGAELENVGDLNGDGLPEIAVSAPGDDDDGGNTGALWILFDLTSLDSQAEMVTDLPPSISDDGGQLEIKARMAGIGGISNAEVAFRRAGSRSFLTVPMAERDAGVFSAAVPHFVAGEQGLEFFCSATNGYGHPTREPEFGIVTLPVRVPEVFFRPRQDRVYELLTFPFYLDNNQARDVFEDDFGPYDPATWRFFDQQNLDSPTELNEEDITIEPGRAYWLLTDGSNNAVDAGPGVTVPTDVPFKILLNPGWNLIGNPFNFDVPIENLSTSGNQLVDLRAYGGDWTSEVTELAPFSGYAVFSQAVEIDTLFVDPDVSRSPNEGTSKPSPSRAQWSVQIIAVTEQSKDAENFAGVVAQASKTFDNFDRPEPPTIGDYVSVYFPHDDWSPNATRFNVDLRPHSEDNWIWPIEIETGDSSAVDLTFQLNEIPFEYGVELIDERFGISQDLRTNNRHSVPTFGKSAPSQVSLVVGKSALGAAGSDEVPSQGISLTAFPNPSIGTTRLAYQLASESVVTIRVFDVLGRMVRSISDGVRHKPGRYARTWDGTDGSGNRVHAGTYFVQIAAGKTSATESVTIVRN